LRRLVVFGDSFVEGYVSHPEVKVTHFNMCHFLEKELNVEVVNCGRRGSGNPSIANKIFRYIHSNDMTNTSILVVWSGIDRSMELNREYMDKDDNFMDFDHPDYIIGGTKKFEKQRLELAEYRNIAAQRLLSETAYHSVRMICQDYDVPVIMTSSIDNTMLVQKRMWQKRVRDINYIQGKIKDCWIESDRPSNTLIDIIAGEWLEEIDNKPAWLPQSNVRIKHMTRSDPSKYPNITYCAHPSDKGNELIAKTLTPYILPILQE
jgi:hypothetical protein